jgi:solute carrier family 34 (sodium-dependent phosphate cotransporter)
VLFCDIFSKTPLQSMSEKDTSKTLSFKYAVIFQMIIAIFIFLIVIDVLTLSLVSLNNEILDQLFEASKNPFLGLFVGLLMAALIHSSSIVTSMMVAIVASGNMTLVQAVPFVMGANIGTTITSTLVSFSFIMKKNEFKKAFAAGVLHDLFNIITVMILFPLEYYFGFLSNTASFISSTLFKDFQGVNQNYSYNFLFTRPISSYLLESIGSSLIALLVSLAGLFITVKFITRLIFKSFISIQLKQLNKFVFKNPFFASFYGTVLTAFVQSSTVITSLIVPLVVSRKISLKKAFPFIMGANVGTTITAAIAALFKPEAAISLALVHFLFNMTGVILFLPFPILRNVPVMVSIYLGNQTTKSRFVGLGYIIFTFFLLPFLLIYFNR